MDTAQIDQLAHALDGLLENDEFRNVALPRPNFWDIIHYGEASYENRYNRMFAWLLDPTANHGLGAKVVNGFLAMVDEKHRSVGSLKVRTETETTVPGIQGENGGLGRSGRIDITVNDTINQVYVAVECKMLSSQHSEQLERYRTWVQDKYKDYSSRYFVFLTEDEQEPVDEYAEDLENEIWVNVTFESLQHVIEAAVDATGVDCPEDARIVIRHFLADQKRRASAGISPLVEQLYFESDRPRFAEILLASISSLDIDYAELRRYASAKKISLPELPENENVIHEKLTASFEALGHSSTDLDRILSLCWDHKPRVADHGINEQTARIVHEFASTVAGQDIQLGQSLSANGLPRFFQKIELSRKGQSSRLTLHDGQVIYFAGNNAGQVPSVLCHDGKIADHRYLDKGCTFNKQAEKAKLQAAHEGSGIKLAHNFVEYLARIQDSGDLVCGCKRHRTGLVTS